MSYNTGDRVTVNVGLAEGLVGTVENVHEDDFGTELTVRVDEPTQAMLDAFAGIESDPMAQLLLALSPEGFVPEADVVYMLTTEVSPVSEVAA